MVLLHVKKTEDQQFLCELPVATTVTDATSQLVALQNLRTRIHRLNLEGKELAQYGPSKPVDQQGIDEYTDQVIQKGANYQQDPTGRRTGQGPDPAAAKTLLKTLDDADCLANKDQVGRKVLMTKAGLEETIDNIRGAVMIAFPQGLPDCDLVRQALEGTEELAGTSHANDELDPATTTLWFAGKQLLPKNQLSHHLGRHEKTKAVIKLQQAGQGAPAKEAPVDAETQKAMMAFYHKKQEEQKKLAENDEDDYTNSAWANPKALKHHFSGVGSVRIR